MFAHRLPPPPRLPPATHAGARVSIVTVVRNGAATVADAIESVLAQNFPGVEYIVIDGASTDGTVEILRRLEGRITKWISEPDAGISDAINKGIALTTAPIVGLLHADDRYLPGAIAASLDALDRNPECGFSFGGCRYVRRNGTSFVIDGDTNYARHIGHRMPFNHPTVFVRRPMYERFGLFRKELGIAMDYDFLLRVHLGGVRGVAIPSVLVEMGAEGASMVHPVRGHYEVMAASNDQGQSPVRSAATFAVASAGAIGRIALERIGADGAVEMLRRLRYPTARKE